MSPDVRAIVRNIDRDVAHETDAALLAIGFETLPRDALSPSGRVVGNPESWVDLADNNVVLAKSVQDSSWPGNLLS
jgi:hypothetical protein